jgi:hypothetical protein
MIMSGGMLSIGRSNRSALYFNTSLEVSKIFEGGVFMWKVRTKDFWMEELPSGFWRICVDGKKAILTRPDLIVDRDDLVLGVWLFSQQFLLCWENADGSWTIVAEEEPDWEE